QKTFLASRPVWRNGRYHRLDIKVLCWIISILDFRLRLRSVERFWILDWVKSLRLFNIRAPDVDEI
ncbi:MAG: hypothetical protein ACYT04_89575, partial [Nostoc sp.]